MPLLIALGLLVFFVLPIFRDKIVDKRNKILQRQHSMIEARYVNEALEKELSLCLRAKENHEAIRKEVFEALRTIEHWYLLTDENFYLDESDVPYSSHYRADIEQVRSNRNIAIKIMLANRGVIDWYSFHSGYFAYLRDPVNTEAPDYIRKPVSNEKKQAYFEYAELMQTLLRSRGVDSYLVYVPERDQYVWKCSLVCNPMLPTTLLTFRKDLTDPPKIPPKSPPRI